MINKIVLDEVATFNNQSLNPNKINYFYGSNGSGKTTISRVISDVSKFDKCKLIWDDESIETIVYNKDFIDENFENSKSIKGIFTLGKDIKGIKETIVEYKEKIDSIKKDIFIYNKSLVSLNEKISNLEEKFQEKCWTQKKKFGNKYKEAFSGYIGKKETFKSKCLSEYQKVKSIIYSEVALDLECIDLEYNTLYNQNIKIFNSIQEPLISDIKEKEFNYILSQVITGTSSAKIADLVTKLQNSDWVKQGIGYLKESDGKCPFCQEKYRNSLMTEMESYFDQTYEKECNELKEFRKEYYKYFTNKIAELRKLVNNENEILDFIELNKIIDSMESLFSNNIKLIDSKIERPSIQIDIESMEELLSKAIQIIKEYNLIIEKNNNIVRNITSKKEELKAKIWGLIANNLKIDIEEYNKEKLKLQKAESGIQQSKVKGENEIKKYENEIKEKESLITSVIPTVNEINKILTSFGFNGFRLKQATSNGDYKIVRNDDQDVNETLSEGEYRFITFLYFYQLMKGSNESSGIVKDKIIFIDDPISSLDSNVLFIVSNLVKNIIKDCMDDKNGIKQVFISTHNIYFYKEIIFRGNRESKTKDEAYWVVRKKNEDSSIKEYKQNPIQTTYELLWRELDNPSLSSKAHIFNTLRRILEYYFNILGGLDYEKCINEFEGEEKLLCKSLISFINDGSHFISDDLVLCLENDDIEKYLEVFKLIFVKLGQASHYNMMMRKITQAS